MGDSREFDTDEDESFNEKSAVGPFFKVSIPIGFREPGHGTNLKCQWRNRELKREKTQYNAKGIRSWEGIDVVFDLMNQCVDVDLFNIRGIIPDKCQDDASNNRCENTMNQSCKHPLRSD